MGLASDNNKAVYKISFCAPDARILVVDDTRMNLMVMKGLLKQTGMQIDTSDSGEECLLLAEKNKYHIIFLDIMMPDMDGLETLRRLLSRKRNENIPVVALTANDASEAEDEYIREGFSDYLSKPVDSENLMQVILKYLPRELVAEMRFEAGDAAISYGRTTEIPDIAGLNADMGIQSCGSAETFLKALKDFHAAASSRIQEIEHYIHTENYRDYTIKVHALKSSARFVGSGKLSEMARYLEECGNHNNIGEIKLKTAELLSLYSELAEAIGVYINEKEEKHERHMIERESLMDALHTIYESVEAFDFDSADSVMEMLNEYAVPDEYYEAAQKLNVLLIDADRDSIMQHINVMAAQTRRPEPAEDYSIEIPDIDAKSAIDALGVAVEEYVNVLRVFTEDEKERLRQMDECIRAENIKLYTVYAHSIKSSAAFIGAVELSKLAERIETAGKEGNLEYLQKTHNELSIKTNRVIENLVFFLRQYSGWDNQDKERGSKEFLLESLSKIEEALTNYEIIEAEEGLNSLSNMLWSDAISAKLAEIEQKLLLFDYEDTRLLVGKLLEMEGNYI